MEIKINGLSIELDLFGLRSEMIYENRNNKALDLEDMTTTKIAELFYCVFSACCEKKKLQPVSFDDFIIALEDENRGDETIFDFWVWYIGTKMTQNEVLQKKLEEVTKKK